MNNPFFSFIVPVYNVEEYLDRCVQSIINQTFENFELLLIDDGSTDNCPAICDTYAARDPRVFVIHKENGGLSDARNKGLEMAKGRYVLFVDSDDYIDRDTCERFLPFAQQGYEIIAGNGNCNVPHLKLCQKPDSICYSGENYMKIALQRGSLPAEAWLYVYDRCFLQKNRLQFKQGIFHEDEQFTPRVFLRATKTINSQINFYHYIVRSGSISTAKDFRKNAADFYETCLELEQIYCQLSDRILCQLLRDSLVMKYLSLYQRGSLYKYGNEYVHKRFVWRNSFQVKTVMKASLFCVSPSLYWKINHFLKQKR